MRALWAQRTQAAKSLRSDGSDRITEQRMPSERPLSGRIDSETAGVSLF
jgi:hypothetical protein